jgi:putative lipoprotein (rSAM/lipoprotein system)
MLKQIKRLFIFVLGFFLFSCDTVIKSDNNKNSRKSLSLIALAGQYAKGITPNPIHVEYGPPPGDIVVEYGMPYAHYAISGSVVDGDGEPVQGIQIAFDDIMTQTDASGKWSIDSETSFVEEFTLQVRDVDGENNGSFKDDQVELNLVQTEPEDGWFQGKFEQSNITVTLDPKTK